MFFSSGAYISGLFIAVVSGCGRGTGEGGVGLGRVRGKGLRTECGGIQCGFVLWF